MKLRWTYLEERQNAEEFFNRIDTSTYIFMFSLFNTNTVLDVPNLPTMVPTP